MPACSAACDDCSHSSQIRGIPLGIPGLTLL
jgi:hypothetical protein